MKNCNSKIYISLHSLTLFPFAVPGSCKAQKARPPYAGSWHEIENKNDAVGAFQEVSESSTGCGGGSFTLAGPPLQVTSLYVRRCSGAQTWPMQVPGFVTNCIYFAFAYVIVECIGGVCQHFN